MKLEVIIKMVRWGVLRRHSRRKTPHILFFGSLYMQETSVDF